ncbi:MAG: STAS domain-containing protein [Rickettsiales bacterium]
MEYKVQHKDNNIRVLFSGQLTFADNQKFKEMLSLLDQDGLKFFELDFTDTSFIDSAGLGMLLLLRDQCQNKHINISIHSAHGQVEKVFMISKFDQLFAMNG